MTDQPSIAVLIDGDNVSPKHASSLFQEMSKLGRLAVKRIYGDWSSTQLKSWFAILHDYAIAPVQQSRYTTGKNATDGRMIIDAMDLLYTDRYDTFCLVSSDSDFASLAMRLRESGVVVYGFGEKMTPKSFVQACNKFVYFESISAVVGGGGKAGGGGVGGGGGGRGPRAAVKIDPQLEATLHKGVDELSGDDGWCHISRLREYLDSAMSDFDPRNYGFAKLSSQLQALEGFDFDFRGPKDNPKQNIYLRSKVG